MGRPQANYEICISGNMDQDWRYWSEGPTMNNVSNQVGAPITKLSVSVTDQLTLWGQN
jgi:hypothetical protein